MTDHHALKPVVRIGKAGLTPAIIDETKKHLKRKKVIKVKFLTAAVKGQDKKRLAEQLAKECNARIAHRAGFVVVLDRTS